MNFHMFKQQILIAAQTANSDQYFELVKTNEAFSDKILDIVNKNGDTVLHLASKSGCLDIIKHCYLQFDMRALTLRNKDDKTPLHVAAHSSQLECLKYLLACNVPVDPLKRSDWTPLMLACTKSNLSVIKELLSHGANPTLQNKDGWTALHIASREGSIDIIRCLLYNNSFLWDTRSKNGRTPLHTAALHGNVNVVELLLNETNHEIDLCDACGITPLMDAVSGNHMKIIEILIKSGASLTKKDCLGRNLVHFSAEAGNVRFLKTFVQDCYLDANSLTNDNLTPLYYAVKGNHLLCVKKLLEMGSDCKLQDNKGRTALDYSNNKEISKILQNVLKT